MAIYEYRCDVDGPFDVTLPIGTAPSQVACPACAGEAGRVYSNPMVSFAPRPLVAALEHEEKTRYSPDIVTKLPATGHKKRQPMAPLTPQLMKLPRP